MKDWNNLIADENLILTKHYTAGRAGQRINKVVLHHNDGNLSIRGCYDVWQTRQASAHYQVDANGRIGQLVHDKDTAWHAGNLAVNRTSIGIEHADISRNPYRISDATLENGAHLTAAICRFYGLGRPQWMVNVFPHKAFSSTECPASIAGSQNAQYMARAQAWYDAMANGTSPAPSQPATPAQPAGLTVDGYWGEATTRRLQEVLGAPYKDGAISRQNPKWRGNCPGCTSGWQWQLGRGGSQTISLIQQRIGATPDGFIGPDTINKLIAYFKADSGATLLDGRLDAESITIKAMQRRLNAGRF